MPKYRNKQTGEVVELPDGIKPTQRLLEQAARNAAGIKTGLDFLAKETKTPVLPGSQADVEARRKSMADQLPTGPLNIGDYASASLQTPQSVQRVADMMKSRISTGNQQWQDFARNTPPDQQNVMQKVVLGMQGATRVMGVDPEEISRDAVDLTAQQTAPVNVAAMGAGAAVKAGLGGGLLSRIRSMMPQGSPAPPEPPMAMPRLVRPTGETVAPTPTQPMTRPALDIVKRETAPIRPPASPVEAQHGFVNDIVKSDLGKRVSNAYTQPIKQDLNTAVASSERQAGASRQFNRAADRQQTYAEQQAEREAYNEARKQQMLAERKSLMEQDKASKKQAADAAKHLADTQKEAKRLADLADKERDAAVKAAQQAYLKAASDPESTVKPKDAAKQAIQMHREAKDVAHEQADAILGSRQRVNEPFRRPGPDTATPPPPKPVKPPTPPTPIPPGPRSEAAIMNRPRPPVPPVTPQAASANAVSEATATAGATKAAAPLATPPAGPPAAPGRSYVSQKASLSAGEEKGISDLDSIQERLLGGERPPGNGMLPANAPRGAVAPPPAIDETTLRQLAQLEQLMKSRGATLPTTTPKVTRPGAITPESIGNVRTDEVLKSNPRFQALDKAERARRYRELGGLDAEAKKIPAEPRFGSEKGSIDPRLQGLMARTGIGAGAGAWADREHPLRGALVGGAIGAGATQFQPGTRLANIAKALDQIRYDTMLTGAAQVSNAAGDTGAAAVSPLVKLLQGEPRAAGQMLKTYANEIGTGFPRIRQGFKQGVDRNFMEASRFNDERPIGPAGRVLRGVDRATKNLLEGGGMTPREAQVMTVSGKPVTRPGKGLENLQSTVAGRLMAPFVRTAINQAETGMALSPARYLSKSLNDLIPAKSGPGNALSNAALSTPALAALAAGYKGITPDSPTLGAVLGPLAFPDRIGHTIRDYQMNGQGGMRGGIRAVVDNIPFLGDVVRNVDSPSKLPLNLIQQWIPPAMYPVIGATTGDYKVKEINSPKEAIQDRIPGWRQSLPDRRDFFGQPLERNWWGKYPDPLYDRDQLANTLGKAGVLRRAPNGTYIPTKVEKADGTDKPLTPTEKSRLQQLRGQSSKELLQQVVDDPEYKSLDPASQAAIKMLKDAQARASKRGLREFKDERNP